MALDHYDMVRTGENSLEKLSTLASEYGAKALSDQDLDRLDDRDFGLIVIASDGTRTRAFPLINKFEVVMSKAASIVNAKIIPPKARNIVDMRIKCAAQRFLPGMRKVAEAQKRLSNIYALTVDDELKMASTSMEKTASGHFAVQASFNGGPMERYPIDTSEQVNRRIRRFETGHRGMHIKYAFEYARNVADRAMELGVEVPEDSAIHLYKTASMSPLAREHINARLSIAPKESHPAYLGLMLKTASATPEQLAVALDSTDRQYAMDSFHGIHFPNAADSILDTSKHAELIDISGTEMERDDFLDALEGDEETFAELLGPETMAELKKDPETILASLPAPHKQKVLEMMANRSS